MKKPRRRPRNLPKKSPTPRQAKFFELYWNPSSPAYRNGARAAALAGYKPGKPGSPQLSVQAGRILKNAGFNEATRAHAHDLGWSPEFVAELGMRGMIATEMRMMLNPEGKSVPVAAPLFSINLAYFKVFWPILAGAEPPSTQPAGPVPPPPPVGGLPQTSELPQPIAEKLAVMQNAGLQERMAMREGVTAAAKYAALAKKDEKQSAAPEIATINEQPSQTDESPRKCSCEVGSNISSDAHLEGCPLRTS